MSQEKGTLIQFHSCGTHVSTSSFKVALKEGRGEQEGDVFVFSSGANICVAFAQG